MQGGIWGWWGSLKSSVSAAVWSPAPIETRTGAIVEGKRKRSLELVLLAFEESSCDLCKLSFKLPKDFQICSSPKPTKPGDAHSEPESVYILFPANKGEFKPLIFSEEVISIVQSFKNARLNTTSIFITSKITIDFGLSKYPANHRFLAEALTELKQNFAESADAIDTPVDAHNCLLTIRKDSLLGKTLIKFHKTKLDQLAMVDTTPKPAVTFSVQSSTQNLLQLRIQTSVNRANQLPPARSKKDRQLAQTPQYKINGEKR